MKYLVIGGTGFIGSHLVDYLLKQGGTVRVPIRDSSSLEWLPVENKSLELIKCDLFNGVDRQKLFNGIEIVFHLAGVTKALNWKKYKKFNSVLTKVLYDSASDSQSIKKFIFLSSQASKGPSPAKLGLNEGEFSRPVSLYGKSKRLAEKYLEMRSGDQKIGIYLSAVFGPRERDFLTFFKIASHNICFFIGYKHRFFDLIYVKDLVKALHIVSEETSGKDIKLNIAGSKFVNWRIFLRHLSYSVQGSIYKVFIPEIIFSPLAILFDFYYRITRQPPLLNKEKLYEVREPFWLLDSGKLYTEYNFKEDFGFEKGINETFDWYRAKGWVKGV